MEPIGLIALFDRELEGGGGMPEFLLCHHLTHWVFFS